MKMLDTSECQKPLRRAVFKGIRSSKFRHVYGSPVKRPRCYENVRITRNAHDSAFCAANPKFIAVVVEVGGGGSFVVLPLDRVGRTDYMAPKVSGHSRQVLDIKWNPFNDNIIASASEDCTVKLWYIPDGGLHEDLTDYLVELQGHRRRVMYLEWHPTAENILLSAGYDHLIIVWNIAKGQCVNVIDCHEDTIYSMSFNRTGSLLATTSKDKSIRIIDPRTGEVLREGDCHRGTKASKVVYLGDTGRLFTTGFSKYNDRQYGVWSQNDLSKPLAMELVDSSSGVLFPYYDHDTRIVYVAGKGDGNVRFYEMLNEAPWVFYLNQFISGSPQRGLGVLPKRGCDTARCEIFRFYKLHATKDLVEPIAMIVPRKSEMFQDDIYPETAAPTPSLTAEEWISGKNAYPNLMSLRTNARVRTYKPVVYKPMATTAAGNGNGDGAVIAVSDRVNDRKFMFLSEETKPDYRPMDKRTELRQSPQIDHRPLGADSYNRQTERIAPPPSHEKQQKLSNGSGSGGSKFADVQRRWNNGEVNNANSHNSGDYSDADAAADRQTPTPSPFTVSGSTPVKSLTGRFDKENLLADFESCADATALRQLVGEQMREIETLKSQLANRDNRIRQLEEAVKKMELGNEVNGSSTKH